MALTPHMETILTAVLHDIRRIEAVPDRPPPGMDRDTWRTLCQEKQELSLHGVRYDLARWIGCPPTRSDSAVFSRALRRMEDLGLLVRVNCWGGRRTTHVRLTLAGKRRADCLLSKPDVKAAQELPDVAETETEDTEPVDWANLVFLPVQFPLDDPAAADPAPENK